MSIVIVLVSGIPGSGKSTLCREWLAHIDGNVEQIGKDQTDDNKERGRAFMAEDYHDADLDIHYVSFDVAERHMHQASSSSPTSSFSSPLSKSGRSSALELKTTQNTASFEPQFWKNARSAVEQYVKSLVLAVKSQGGSEAVQGAEFVQRYQTAHQSERLPNNVKTIILLDDNFYYRSMRHPFFQMARDYSCGFAHLVVSVDLEVALLRNSLRQGVERIPDAVVKRMSQLFELPMANLLHTKSDSSVDCSFTQSKSTRGQIIGSGGAGGIGFSLIFDNNASKEEVFDSESSSKIFWDLVTAAASSPLGPVLSQFELNARKEDREKTKKSVMHRMDQMLRSTVRDLLQESSRLGLMRTIPDIGKLLSKKKQGILTQYRNVLKTGAISCICEGPGGAFEAAILELRDAFDDLVFGKRRSEAGMAEDNSHAKGSQNDETTMPTSDHGTTHLGMLRKIIDKHKKTKAGARVLGAICTHKSDMEQISLCSRKSSYRSTDSFRFVVNSASRIFEIAATYIVEEKSGSIGDAAVSSQVSEIDLFESLTYIGRTLRNVCVQSAQEQHRIMIAGALTAALDILGAAVGMSSKSNLPTAGWVTDDAAGGGEMYVNARNRLIRACAQLGANALARNPSNQYKIWPKFFQAGLVSEIVKVADRRRDRGLLAAVTTMVWYCVQMADAESILRLGEIIGFDYCRVSSHSNHCKPQTEASKNFISALLRAAVPMINAGSDSKRDGSSSIDPAFDTIDLIIRACLQQDSGLSHLANAVKDSPTNRLDEISEEVSMSQTFVSAPEVILYHFVAQILEEGEDFGRYGDNRANHKDSSNDKTAGSQTFQNQWFLSSKDAAWLVQKAEMLLHVAQKRHTGFSETAAMHASLGMPSRKAIVSWALIEGEALEVILSSLCSALVQVTQIERQTMGMPESITRLPEDAITVQDTKSVLCEGTLLRSVLLALMYFDNQHLHDDTNKQQDKLRLPVRSGLKTLLMQCVANLCSASRRMQDMVRELGGIIVVLNCCSSDVAHPMLREWAMVAVRHICDDNIPNQEFIASLEQIGETTVRKGDKITTADKLAALKAAGIDTEIGDDGRMTLRRSRKKL